MCVHMRMRVSCQPASLPAKQQVCACDAAGRTHSFPVSKVSNRTPHHRHTQAATGVPSAAVIPPAYTRDHRQLRQLWRQQHECRWCGCGYGDGWDDAGERGRWRDQTEERPRPPHLRRDLRARAVAEHHSAAPQQQLLRPLSLVPHPQCLPLLLPSAPTRLLPSQSGRHGHTVESNANQHNNKHDTNRRRQGQGRPGAGAFVLCHYRC